ncbi:hypothetical protein [Asticcacaulis taihuensis]|uniref:Uncharacterized protein n=1 Tax=Asticcacaulis taihuensis TaxID=260084 RepID=A0A1G4R7I7_9CAUL|nr:hypothetical protein [Asticcacaulis taihuensis]SCW52822.1 hypothetical protein SAMN02927928_1638 [Asticcacaulis taihuensis]
MASSFEDIKGDPTRQALGSLQGYAYQIYASTKAWIELKSNETLFLEVAEDYATAVGQAINNVQVKNTGASLTLNSAGARAAIESLVKLTALNPNKCVNLRYLTTAQEGIERSLVDKINGIGGIAYWRRAAQGADIQPLRARLEAMALNEETKSFINVRSDEELRGELVRRLIWDCEQVDLSVLIIAKN